MTTDQEHDMNNRHHLAPVPDDFDADAALKHTLTLMIDMHIARGVLDGTAVYDHASDVIVHTESGPSPETIDKIDQARRNNLTARVTTTVTRVVHPALIVDIPTTNGPETVTYTGGTWRCTCDVQYLLDLDLTEHVDDTCSHIATVSALVRHNPPPHLADLPPKLLESIRDHHATRGY